MRLVALVNPGTIIIVFTESSMIDGAGIPAIEPAIGRLTTTDSKTGIYSPFLYLSHIKYNLKI